jgi:glycosyltransferase involved in cell wall biosynthesis
MVLSDRSSFPEIAQDAAEYFDPLKEDSICSAVEKVIYDDSKRTELKYMGLSRIKYFSWKECAVKMLKIYEKVL